MLPALGKPLVVRLMDRLYRTGIHDYTIVVGEKEGAVAGYLNAHWMPDVNVEFRLKSGSISLGMILRSIAQKHETPFVLCSYDHFTHSQFPARLLKQHSELPDALILSVATTSLSEEQHGNYTIMDGQRITQITSTPPANDERLRLIEFTAFGSDVISYLTELSDAKTHEFSWGLVDFARDFIQQGGKSTIAETNWVLQIQSDRDLLTLNKHLLEEGSDAHILSELPYTVQINPPVRIDPQVSVGQGASLGPYVYLEKGSVIGRNATLRNAIVLQNAHVAPEETIENTIITTQGPI